MPLLTPFACPFAAIVACAFYDMKLEPVGYGEKSWRRRKRQGRESMHYKYLREKENTRDGQKTGIRKDRDGISRQCETFCKII